MEKSFAPVTRSKAVGKFLSAIIFLGLAFSSFGPGTAQVAKVQLVTISAVISDSQFVFHPTLYGFDAARFISTQPGWLKDYSVEFQGEKIPAADAITFFAFKYSLSPQLLLTLLELQSQALSASDLNKERIDLAAGNPDPSRASFVKQLQWLAEELYIHFYSFESGQNIELADGTVVQTAPDINAGSYAIVATFAHVTTRQSWQKTFGDSFEEFTETFMRFFWDPLIELPLAAIDVNEPAWELPYLNGEAWTYGSQGAHDDNVDWDGSHPGNIGDSAIDLLPPGRIRNPGGNCNDNGDVLTTWVRAAAPGRVVYEGLSLVVIDHGGGYSTTYYHIANPVVHEPSSLGRGDRIGNPSNRCGWGGRSDPSHVHFAIIENGSYVPILGKTLSGWRVRAEQYLREYLEKNGEIRKPQGWSGNYSDSVPSRSKPGVTVFSDSSLQGRAETFSVSDLSLIDNFIRQDEISSALLPSGWGVRFWEHVSFEGACLLFPPRTGPFTVFDFATQYVFEDCGKGGAIGQRLNDKISSMEIFEPNYCPATLNVGLLDLDQVDTCEPPPNPSPPPNADNAMFISDVTLPDGTVVSPGQALGKTWRMRNTGTTTWGSGYQLVFVSGEQMGAPSAVNVPTTAPGNTADISINLTAPTSGGDHTGYWRLRNPQGTFFGPTIWVSLNVLAPNPGSGKITLFDVSPASPSAATLVHVVGRVRWFPEFRSMRFVLGNEVQEMTNFRQVGDQLEISADWNTATLARGNYALALEVATQGDPGWVTPERQVKTYTLSGTPAPMNRAPNRPSLTSPYDWYVYYSGNTATLCAQADGDPDGDAIAGYYFDIFDSAQLWNSGWTGSNCVTTSALGPYSYQWRVKVRDGSGAESGWSDSRHFTLVNPSLSISELYFQPLDANSEQVKIRTCTTGQAGIGITMRVSVNDANDGSGNGNWHIIKEQGSPCFNDIDAPIWNTLEYGDGPHRVRSEAHGLQTGWNGAAVREETYTLPHRRPPAPQTVSPSTPNDNGTWWNTPTITFRWKLALRATSYRLRVTTSADVWNDPAPVLDVALGSTATVYTYTFGQDYDRLYWSVRASNGSGAGDSGAAWFGIDRAKPTCSIQPLPAVVYDNVFQVTWAGTDNASGVRSYEIRYLDFEADNHAIWEQPLASTIYDLFTGRPGHTYRFFCRATDKAGNTSDMPANYERSVRVDPSARPPTPWWNGAYTQKRNLTILNNMPGMTLPAGYPVRVRFDSTTNPTAAEIYNASQSSPKCNDLRVVYIDTTELDRVMEKCSIVEVEFWFRSQVSIAGGESNNTAHQLYYGNTSPDALLANAVQVFYPGMDANTVGLWYLEGDANDASSYNHNGQWLGGASWSAGKFGQGISLPGNVQTQGGIRVPGTEAMRVWSFTVEAFVKRARNDGYCGGHFASQGESGSERERWFAEIDFDKLHLQIWNRGDRRGTNGSYPIDAEWHHVAVAFDNNTLEYRFYRDGNLISSGYMDTWEFKPGNANFYIGNLFPYIDGQMNTFCGSIDGVRLSNVARSTFGAYATFGSITNEPTTGAGAPIAPPISGAADLAVLNLDTYPNLTGGVLVQAVIQNQGNLDTQNGFNTGVYLNHVPLGSGDYAGSIQFWVNDPIAAGAAVTLTTVITDLSRPSGANLQSVGSVSESSGTLYAQVDSTGAVSETDNLNNIYSAGTEICVASPDAYESDDSAGAAKPISVGQTQTHNFSGPGDRDWMTFTAQGGMTYTLRTFNLGVSADSYLYLYDTNGTTLLASNDDYDGSLASWLDWTAPATGAYYVAVQHWNPNVGGCGTTYDLAVTRALTDKVFLPIIFKNH